MDTRWVIELLQNIHGFYKFMIVTALLFNLRSLDSTENEAKTGNANVF